MTRKHFEAIARAVKSAAKDCPYTTAEQMHRYIAIELARELLCTNERFDTKRFLRACDIEV